MLMGSRSKTQQHKTKQALLSFGFWNIITFLQGNVSLWKPSDTAMLSNYLVYNIYREAGLPPGVINFIPADGPVFGDAITASPDLAGINFTGSVK